MQNLIIERSEISLSEAQIKMIKSGWGEDTVNNSKVEKITYLSDGLKVKGYIATPQNLDKDKFPCVIWNRGGYGNRGAIDQFNAKGIFGQLASWGYVVFASQYRGNDDGEGHDDFGGDDVNDILNLIPLADSIPDADTNVWGIEGWSRGGMMTYLVLTKNHDFKAAVITGGIANLRCNADESKFMRILYQQTLGNYSTDEFSSRCEQRSIVNFADKLSRKTNYLIIHGNADARVSPHDSLDIAYKMLELNVPHRLMMLEGGDHFLKSHRKEVDEIRKKWYEKFLVN